MIILVRNNAGNIGGNHEGKETCKIPSQLSKMSRKEGTGSMKSFACLSRMMRRLQ
jgi:hypothetical protein